MSAREIETLERLHTDAVDAMNGYGQALKDSDGHSLFTVFEKLHAFHRGAASELADEMSRVGARPENSGSFMSVIHESIMKLRSLVGGLDESVLPGLIDGEQRNLAEYDAALRGGTLRAPASAIVTRQRDKLSEAIDNMRTLSRTTKAADLASSK